MGSSDQANRLGQKLFLPAAPAGWLVARAVFARPRNEWAGLFYVPVIFTSTPLCFSICCIDGRGAWLVRYRCLQKPELLCCLERGGLLLTCRVRAFRAWVFVILVTVMSSAASFPCCVKHALGRPVCAGMEMVQPVTSIRALPSVCPAPVSVYSSRPCGRWLPGR